MIAEPRVHCRVLPPAAGSFHRSIVLALAGSLRGLLLALVLLLMPGVLFSHTYPEPWFEDAIKDSYAVVRAKVRVAPRSDNLIVDVEALIAGPPVLPSSSFMLVGYSHVEPVSGDPWAEHTLKFDEGNYGYLVLTGKGPDGDTYQIPTPSTGFFPIRERRVLAAPFISFIRAPLPVDYFEMLLKATFDAFHNHESVQPEVIATLEELLSAPVVDPEAAGFVPTESRMATFYKQYAALEMLYYLRHESAEELVLPFLDAKSYFLRLAAVRALAGSGGEASKGLLVNVLKDPESEVFIRYIALKGIEKQRITDLRPELEVLKQDETPIEAFPMRRIMDSRVPPEIPATLGKAVEAVLAGWDAQ